jgi:hypothetical protein
MHPVWQFVLVALAASLIGGCSDDEVASAGLAPTSTQRGPAALPPDGVVLPPPALAEPNPLALPAMTARELDKGQRIFAVPERMLRGAKLGAAFVLRSASYLRREGSDYVVRVGFGKPYPIHPGYVVVPRPGRFRRGANVVAAHRGTLRHGVVTGLRRDRVLVQYVDLGFRLAPQRLAPSRIGLLGGGLEPGAYAAYRADQEYRHVLLVSKGGSRGKTQWLVLEHEGQTRLIDAAKLVTLPPSRFKPKKGSAVLAAWRGAMVRATVRDLERPALYSLKRPRAGAPLLSGPGMMMPAP